MSDPRTATPGQPLSNREAQVLAGMAAGLSNREIGQQLYLTENTVKTHAQRLFRKLGARDRGQAVALGYDKGLLTQGEAKP